MLGLPDLLEIAVYRLRKFKQPFIFRNFRYKKALKLGYFKCVNSTFMIQNNLYT